MIRSIYDSLFFMDHNYHITNEPVDVSFISHEIGEVKFKTEKNLIPVNNNYSNCLSIGTKIYSLKDSEIDEVAVQNNRENLSPYSPEYVKGYLVRK